MLDTTEHGRIQRLSKFFGYPLLSQERVKLRNSNFVGTFVGSIGTKDHEKCWVLSRGRSQGVPKIQGPHVYGASRGHLCDSTAFLWSTAWRWHILALNRDKSGTGFGIRDNWASWMTSYFFPDRSSKFGTVPKSSWQTVTLGWNPHVIIVNLHFRQVQRPGIFIVYFLAYLKNDVMQVVKQLLKWAWCVDNRR